MIKLFIKNNLKLMLLFFDVVFIIIVGILIYSFFKI